MSRALRPRRFQDFGGPTRGRKRTLYFLNGCIFVHRSLFYIYILASKVLFFDQVSFKSKFKQNQ
jgi:hypothetical protein